MNPFAHTKKGLENIFTVLHSLGYGKGWIIERFTRTKWEANQKKYVRMSAVGAKGVERMEVIWPFYKQN